MKKLDDEVSKIGEDAGKAISGMVEPTSTASPSSDTTSTTTPSATPISTPSSPTTDSPTATTAPVSNTSTPASSPTSTTEKSENDSTDSSTSTVNPATITPTAPPPAPIPSLSDMNEVDSDSVQTFNLPGQVTTTTGEEEDMPAIPSVRNTNPVIYRTVAQNDRALIRF